MSTSGGVGGRAPRGALLPDWWCDSIRMGEIGFRSANPGRDDHLSQPTFVRLDGRPGSDRLDCLRNGTVFYSKRSASTGSSRAARIAAMPSWNESKAALPTWSVYRWNCSLRCLTSGRSSRECRRRFAAPIAMHRASPAAQGGFAHQGVHRNRFTISENALIRAVRRALWRQADD